MTGREWKPGDVAATRYGRSLVARRDTHKIDSPHWHHENGGFDALESHPDARPLVVIDPEDDEAVERLIGALWVSGAFPDATPLLMQTAISKVRAALREFADPTPSIEEPTGLGAVVVDVEGIRWTRVEAGHAKTRNPWYPADAADFQPDEWRNLCAVEVLSEGVR